jgi:hypothetical protein
VAEKRAFFRWKWLKNVRFSGGSFQVEVAEKRVFFWQKWLKNVCIFQLEVAENMRFSGGSG